MALKNLCLIVAHYKIFRLIQLPFALLFLTPVYMELVRLVLYIISPVENWTITRGKFATNYQKMGSTKLVYYLNCITYMVNHEMCSTVTMIIWNRRTFILHARGE